MIYSDIAFSKETSLDEIYQAIRPITSLAQSLKRSVEIVETNAPNTAPDAALIFDIADRLERLADNLRSIA
jgi:hypothetical protein